MFRAVRGAGRGRTRRPATWGGLPAAADRRRPERRHGRPSARVEQASCGPSRRLRGRARGAQLRAYRIPLPSDEVTTRVGIPVTTAARTLFDLAADLDPEYLEAAITEAEIQRLTSPTSLDALVARYPGRKATPVVRELLRQAQIGRHVTKSDLEIAFLGFLRRHGLPRPDTNVRIAVRGTPIVDAVWRDQRFVVELDSYGIHTTRRNFERDRARDRALTVAGWRVVRITWRQLHRHQRALASELRALLGPGGPMDTVSRP